MEVDLPYPRAQPTKAIELVEVTLISSLAPPLMNESVKMATPDELLNLILEIDAFFYIMAIVLMVQVKFVLISLSKRSSYFLASESYPLISTSTCFLDALVECRC